MKEIPLTQGKVALVSDEDYEELSKYKWQTQASKRNFYATRRIKIGINKYIGISMHKSIMNTPKGFDTDHIDGNGLNNQRENLRICTHSENMRNQKMHRNNTSGLIGAYWNKRAKKWMSLITADCKDIYLGLFLTKEEAHKAYCEASEKYHKEYRNKLITN